VETLDDAAPKGFDEDRGGRRGVHAFHCSARRLARARRQCSA
jgi:hypothetical protein